MKEIIVFLCCLVQDLCLNSEEINKKRDYINHPIALYQNP